MSLSRTFYLAQNRSYSGLVSLPFFLRPCISCSLGLVDWFENLISRNIEKRASFGIYFKIINLIVSRYIRLTKSDGQADSGRVKLPETSTEKSQKKIRSFRSLIVIYICIPLCIFRLIFINKFCLFSAATIIRKTVRKVKSWGTKQPPPPPPVTHRPSQKYVRGREGRSMGLRAINWAHQASFLYPPL